jgi:hypothetical protein
MACIIATKSKRRFSVGLAAGIIGAATVALGTFSGSASAEWHGDNHRGYHHNWNGGYYRSPPVVYGSPYYYPPPVVYGPGIGLNFNIR